MEVAVDQVLAERERRARRGPAVVSLASAVVLHGGVVALVILGPRLSPPPPPLDYVAVQVVPAQRLGAEHEVQRPTPPSRHEEPKAPETPAVTPPQPKADDAPVLRREAPPPKPVKLPKPKPLPPDTRIDPTTLPKVLPPPREVLAKKIGATPAVVAPPPLTPPVAPALPGAATGTLAGKAAVGSSVAALDNPDFTYDYYIAQLVARIDQNWTRPPVGTGVHAILSFRIRTDGSITALVVRQSSSFDTFDLAALRAVQNGAPFPPLPRAYTLNHDSIGVNVTLR